MASNFTIRFRQNGRDRHIALKGDFDGSAAHLLADALKRNGAPGRRVVVDTTHLSIVHPFGREVFRVLLSREPRTDVHFVGPYGKDLRGAPCLE